MATPLNPEFTECLIKFGAAYGTYKAIGGEDQLVASMKNQLMEDATSSVGKAVSALNEVKNIASKVPGIIADDAKEFFDNAISDLGDPLEMAKKLINAGPFGNVLKVIKYQIGPELYDKISPYFEQAELSAGIKDVGHYLALVAMSSIRGVGTIELQKAMLKELERQTRSIMRRVYDTPEFRPPMHPFKETVYHLQNAKRQYMSVSSQVISTGFVDSSTLDSATNDMKEASDSLVRGSFSQKFLDQSGLGQFVDIESNMNGASKRILRDNLQLYKFLPPVHLGVNIIVIKNIRNQIGAYNANLKVTTDFINFVSSELIMMTDFKRLVGLMVQYFAAESDEMQASLDKASNGPISATTIALQTEVYARAVADYWLSNKMGEQLRKYGGKNIEDAIPSLKRFKKFMQNINVGNCPDSSASLDIAINGLVSAYHQRISGRINARTLEQSGERVLYYISKQREYLDCVNKGLGELLEPLGLNSLVKNKALLNGIAAVGAVLSALQGVNIPTMEEAMDYLMAQFNPRLMLVRVMKDNVLCMKNTCRNMGVSSVLTKLLGEMVSLEKLLKTNFAMTKGFAKQAKYQTKYQDNKILQIIEQLLAAAKQLSC